MLALSVLLLSGVLKWEDCLGCTPAWDTLLWFSGGRVLQYMEAMLYSMVRQGPSEAAGIVYQVHEALEG